ncbi:hypothetical protein BCR34DRAFT_494243 [Clohesyomyces aquaticus]|uniref:Uncharacterized protein n=1 Tax=Clohesyomyces aquaticus TaxID=1231657 RepID=A0A1Y1YSI5_9PLEO|nr:hypothetical protein BCR34DRAFT_494243 [Clohesyomyces aquaticus]
MTAIKSNVPRPGAKPDDPHQPTRSSRLARVMRRFDELVADIELSLLWSLEEGPQSRVAQHEMAKRRQDIRRLACRLAMSELNAAFTRKQIRSSLADFEAHGRWAQHQLVRQSVLPNLGEVDPSPALGALCNGHFRLCSTDLFDLLGQPLHLRFGTLRFHIAPRTSRHDDSPEDADFVNVELALNDSFYVADSSETREYHRFTLPATPSLRNHGILSRRWDDGGAFPSFDSWLLFTFLGHGCLKLELPIEMCADIYGSTLTGRENEDVLFWGVFVEDEPAA